ncbi:hypothetical protein [Streptomyces sp. NPDC006971]|uniref:hypothetical protein n=1 Tax=Streptomyces sp. NPDC006971 TaxID=3154784 RepID=UPI0033F27C6D
MDTRDLPRPTHHDRAGPRPAAYWKPLDTLHRPVAARTLCARRHSRGASGTAWVHRPWHQLACPRHHRAAPDPSLAGPAEAVADR